MLSVFMKIRQLARLLRIASGLAFVALASACEKVPLLAPSGSTIVLTSAANVLPTGGSVDIIAHLLEAAGTPPHSGTQVTFTTTLGTIEPSSATTDINGRVVVKFLAGSANGTARITAASGGAATGTAGALTIAVGTAAVGRVAVSATPATVPNSGGSTTILATVLDINGNALPSAPVSFVTTAGTLSASIVHTDANGIAATVLVTSQQAVVTASVGAQAPAAGGSAPGNGTGSAPSTSGQASGSVTVTISVAPTVVITPPSQPPSAGLPASFVFAVTAAPQNGSAIRELRVTWGDGTSSNLGAVVGNAVASHVYDSPGTYTISATVTDAAGNSSTVSTSVTVIPVPRPTVIVTPSPPTVTVNGTVTFTIQVTAVPGIGIQSTTIDFGDGTSQQLGGASSASVPHRYSTTGTKTITVTVIDTTGATTLGTTSVSVTP
jgi:hypothetical protein